MQDYNQIIIDLHLPNPQGNQPEVLMIPNQLMPKVFDDQMFLHLYDFHNIVWLKCNYNVIIHDYNFEIYN